MNPNHIAAYGALHQAQTALQQGQKQAARAFAVQAAQLAPDLEEVWLMLAGLAAPRASLAYLSRALEINPQSERARKGMEWALKRARSAPAARRPQAVFPPQAAPAAAKNGPSAAVLREAQKSRAARPWAGVGLLVVALVSLGIVGWVALTALAPALAALPAGGGAAWAPVPLQKPDSPLAPEPSPTAQISLSMQDAPAVTAAPLPSFSPTPLFSPSPIFSSAPTASETPTVFPTEIAPLPTETPAAEASPTLLVLPLDTPVLPSDTPVVLPPSDSPAPTPIPPAAGGSFGGERWVEVNLTQQMVYAWEGDTLAASFVVSTGTWQYPTVTGTYRVYARFKYTDMSGPGYYLPDVPNTMYFYEGYALHGTYWHSNFGTPMSHGCVNLSIPDSEWLFNWAPSNLLVNVHY